MLKRYFHRENEQKDVLRNVDKGKQEARITNGVESENQEINQAASVACVLENEETDEPAIEEWAAVQTNERKPPKPLKVNSIPGWDVGPDEIKAKQN